MRYGSGTEGCWTKSPRRCYRRWTDSVELGERFFMKEAKYLEEQKRQRARWWPRKEAVLQRTKEGARCRGAMPSSFANPDKTNEPKKVRFVVPPEVPHDVESDVAEETMSVTVKVAKEIDEPHDIDLPTAECQSRTPSEKRRVTQR